MNSFRPEPHVAQQSRRDKLRVPPDPAQFRSSIYDPPLMFSPAATGLLDLPAAEASFMNPSTSGFQESAGWCDAPIPISIHTPLIPSHLYNIKNGLSAYQDLPADLPSEFYHNSSLQDVVITSSALANQSLATSPWTDSGNELLLLHPETSSVWANRNTPQPWFGEGELGKIKSHGVFGSGVPTVTSTATACSSTQSLSLSLSSNPVPELHPAQFQDRLDLAVVKGPPYSAGEEARCGSGPLGPFTGYAAILKSSKFLRPAQQLLDEFCSVMTGSKIGKIDGGGGDHRGNGRGGSLGVSSLAFYRSMDGDSDHGGGRCQIHRPEFQHKKAKLLYMQEEVCKRYKQYHQQMQMVVSSFETVAGLSAATPYTSMALKAISKHFRTLKSAISDQLRHVSSILGEEFMSSPASSSKCETTGAMTPRSKYMDQNIRKQKASAESSLNFLEHCQPVWRPQRGLPERAVAVLRAWLFDHFLHPYPTDTDKHMLATQTGLSRNQVSNWFINARVRLWKPMVEEIHMLETKGTCGKDINPSSRDQGKLMAIEEGGQRSSDQLSELQSNKLLECLPMDPMLDEESSRAMEQWHREKRSRMEECGIPEGMDASLMTFAGYHQGTMDIGGLGAVSLTLGLRHNEGSQQQQEQIRRHFGSHMVHDFVG